MNKKSNKKVFWLIWAVAVIPMLSATAMYHFGVFIPENTVSKGQLVEQAHLDEWQLLDRGQPWEKSKQWQLLHTQLEGCLSSDCQSWSTALPQIIKLLGKDKDRVALHQVGAGSPMLQTGQLANLGNAIWLADPLGNLVLRYDLKSAPEDLLKDLKKLLKLSGIG